MDTAAAESFLQYLKGQRFVEDVSDPDCRHRSLINLSFSTHTVSEF
jgi:hypothetical protein